MNQAAITYDQFINELRLSSSEPRLNSILNNHSENLLNEIFDSRLDQFIETGFPYLLQLLNNSSIFAEQLLLNFFKNCLVRIIQQSD